MKGPTYQHGKVPNVDQNLLLILLIPQKQFKLFLQNTQLICFIFQVGHYISQHQLLKQILTNNDFQKLDKVSCTIGRKQSRTIKMKWKKRHSFVKGMSLIVFDE